MMFDTPANENNVYAQHMVGLIYDMFYKDYVNSKFWYEKLEHKVVLNQYII